MRHPTGALGLASSPTSREMDHFQRASPFQVPRSGRFPIWSGRWGSNPRPSAWEEPWLGLIVMASDSTIGVKPG